MRLQVTVPSHTQAMDVACMWAKDAVLYGMSIRYRVHKAGALRWIVTAQTVASEEVPC